MDGVGEWATATYGIGKGREITILKEIRFPHSLGLLYSAFTAYLGFEVNEGEYKVMGMAPFGEPKYLDKVYRLIRVEKDGSFQLDMDYFASTILRPHVQRQVRGSVRISERSRSYFFTPTSGYPSYFGERPANYNSLARENQHYADIAASIQVATEETLLKMANHLYRETGMKKLCMAGGVALNSVANGRILRETPFEEIYVQPSAGDGGGAMGLLSGPTTWSLENRASLFWSMPIWARSIVRKGSKHSSARIISAMRESTTMKVSSARSSRELQVARSSAGFRAGFEWGPRALGNRSILADPRRGGHQGHRQHQDQVSRTVPSLRAFGPGRSGPPFFDPAGTEASLSGPLHALRRRCQRR